MNKKSTGAVVVRNVAEAVIACRAAAATRLPLLIASPPSAATFAGPLWFKALAHAARKETGAGDDVLFVLDCADAPGAALAAIRAGLEAIAFGGRGRVRAKIEAIAKRAGVVVLDLPRNAFDLTKRPRPEALIDWFSTRGASLQRPRRSAKRTATQGPPPTSRGSGAKSRPKGATRP